MQLEDLRSILDSINDAIIIHGLDGRFIDVNSKMLKMYGVTRDEALNSSGINDYSSPENTFEMMEGSWKKVLGGESLTFEWKARRPGDGSIFDVEVCLRKVTLLSGDVVLATMHDISDIKKQEQALKHAQRIAHLGSWDVDEQGITHWSDEFYRILGLQPQSQTPTFSLLKSFIYPGDTDRVLRTIATNRNGGEVYAIEYRILTANGKIRHVRSEGQAVLDSYGVPVKWYGILQDITEQKRAVEVLKESEAMLRMMFDQAAIGIATRDLNGNYLQANRKVTEILGYSWEELKNVGYRDITYKADIDREEVLLSKMLAGEISNCRLEKRYNKKGGEIIWANVIMFLTRDLEGSPKQFISIFEDITEQKLLVDKIRTSLKEKEVMLKEVNHRVKNHLQIINSLLSLQSCYIKDKDDLAIFRETQNSIRSMALIHEKIYSSGNLAEINLTEYLQLLASHLMKSFTLSDKVRLSFDMDTIYLPVEKAVPCGLIANELVTNCLKYAFPGDRKGEIVMSLRQTDKLTFTVRDNGIGFPEGLDYHNSDSLGMQIIGSLTEQLDGTFELERGNGTTVHIRIPV